MPSHSKSTNAQTPNRVSDHSIQSSRPTFSIEISSIIIPNGRRPADAETVKLIADSFRLIGQKTPISVRPASVPDKYVLVAGDKRVKAAQSLGWPEIAAVIEDADEAKAELWQLDENFARQELTVQQRSENHARRVELVAVGVGQVVQKGSIGRPNGGISAAARIIPMPGKSEGAKRKALERDLRIAAMNAEAKKAATAAGLDDNQSALLEIARQSGGEAQLNKVAELQNRAAERSTRTKHKARPDLPATISPPLQTERSPRDDAALVDLLLLTPNARDIDRMVKDYGEEDELERTLPPQLRRLARSAAVIVHARVSDMPAIVNKVLGPICGFRGRCRTFLVSRPSGNEITENGAHRRRAR
jgi:hypothetical protein